MPITEKQRLARMKKLGSSDAPAILGVSPWKTATDVYWSKASPEATAPTQGMQTGNRLEGALLDFVQEELGCAVKRNQYRVSRIYRMFAAHLDGLVLRTQGVEAKYVGQSQAGDWGEPGTDEVPDHVLVQVQHAMYCADLEKMWVAAAVAGYSLDWRLYCVQRSEKLIRIIVERELEFWHSHVLREIPPTPGPPPLEVMQALRREPGSLVFLDATGLHAVTTYEQLGEIRRNSERAAEVAKAELLNLLGEAEGARLPDGTLITYLKQNSPPRCDLKRLRADVPEVYDHYVTQSAHRVLRIKRPKEERYGGDIAERSEQVAGPNLSGPPRIESSHA